MDMSGLDNSRYFLKDLVRQTVNFSRTDQYRGIAPPPVEKPYPPDAKTLELPPPHGLKSLAKLDVYSAISNRQSRRNFLGKPLSLEELSFLLWATQGIQRIGGPGAAFRTVPSAGCRHALETYLCVMNISGLSKGIYRYLPLKHKLLFISSPENLEDDLAEAALGQTFVAKSAATFIWSTIPYRMEWRYAMASHKVIAIDAGHVCQNLYIACEAIGAGTCAVAAYDQLLMDKLIGADGKEEFAIYLAPVGKV